MSGTEILIVGGVVVGVAALGGGALLGPPAPDPVPWTSQPTGGSTTGDQLGDNSDGALGGVTSVGPGPSYRAQIAALQFGSRAQVSSGNLAGSVSYDPSAQLGLPAGTDSGQSAAIDTANAACQTFWGQASDAAKMQAAALLNTNFNLNPPLTGHESWSELSERCGQAAGKIGGSALGGSIAGPVGTYIGGMVGSLLGGKVSDFINDNAQGVYDWCKQKLGDLLGSAWGDAEDLASSVYNDTLGAIF